MWLVATVLDSVDLGTLILFSSPLVLIPGVSLQPPSSPASEVSEQKAWFWSQVASLGGQEWCQLISPGL